MTLRGHGYYLHYPSLSPVSSVAFSPDGERIVSGSYDSTVKIWNAKTGAEVMTMSGHTDLVSDVAFSPDGKRFASASSDNTIRICDVATGDELLVLEGHEDEVLSVAFSPDGKRIASGSKDDTVRIWDAATGDLVQILPIHGWVWKVCFSPDGKTLLITSQIGDSGSNQTITLWESAAPAGGYESRKTTATARKIVDTLYDKLGLYCDVIDKLKADKTLDRSIIKVALQIANSRRYVDAEKLTNEEWEIVSSPDKDMDVYKSILQKAQKVKNFEPDNWSVLRTLGVAQYRVGFYDQAFDTLTGAAKIRVVNHLEPDHANVSFTAMTLYRLDRTQEAQESIKKLYGLFKEIMWGEKGHYPYLIEAEKLLVSQNTKVYLVWEHIENEQYDQALQLVKQLGSSKDPERASQIERALKYLGRVYYKVAESGERSETYTQMFADYQAVIAIDPDHAGALNALASMLVTSPVEGLRDVIKAVEYATKSCELTDWKKHDQLSTLAMAYSETGNSQEAIKWQKKALELLGEDELDKWQANYQERLKLYESGKSYLTDSRWNYSKGDLVSWWKLDESREGIVVDSSGNGLDGNLVGDAKIISDPQRGNVLSLDGDGDYMDCGNNPAFNITGSITMAAWIKVNKFDRDWQAIVTKGEQDTWSLRRHLDSNNVVFYGSQAVSGYSDYVGFDFTVGEGEDGNVNDGRWHHIAGVYDGTKACLYIDGVLSGPADLYGRFATNNDPIYIGEESTNQMYGWNGLIDDVRIYSYALSAEEISELYQSESVKTQN
jgi:tetratricopeptide (TPR) repeat protein